MATVTATEALQGVRDLQIKLEGLDKKVRSQLERKGTRAGTKKFADRIKRNVPVDRGLYKRSITVRALKRKKGRIGHRVTLKTDTDIGARRFKQKYRSLFRIGKNGKRYFYPAIIEYGAKNRPAKAPMRKAFDSGKDEALQEVIKSIRDGIRAATGT